MRTPLTLKALQKALPGWEISQPLVRGNLVVYPPSEEAYGDSWMFRSYVKHPRRTVAAVFAAANAYMKDKQ